MPQFGTLKPVISFVFLLFFSLSTHSAILSFQGPEDCLENGGKYLCKDPEIKPWVYSMCNPSGNYLWQLQKKCIHWNDGVSRFTSGAFECLDSKALHDESTIAARLISYQKDWTGDCQVNVSGYSWPTHGFYSSEDPEYEYDGRRNCLCH